MTARNLTDGDLVKIVTEMTSGIQHLKFYDSWVHGYSGRMFHDRITGISSWENPVRVGSITTVGDLINVMMNTFLREGFDGLDGICFGKCTQDGKEYLPSSECLTDVGIKASIENAISWDSSKLSFVEFKLVVINVLLSIFNIIIDTSVYKKILVVDMLKRQSRGTRVNYKIRIWSTGDLEDIVLQKELDDILRYNKNRPTCYIPNAFDFDLCRKFYEVQNQKSTPDLVV